MENVKKFAPIAIALVVLSVFGFSAFKFKDVVSLRNDLTKALVKIEEFKSKIENREKLIESLKRENDLLKKTIEDLKKKKPWNPFNPGSVGSVSHQDMWWSTGKDVEELVSIFLDHENEINDFFVKNADKIEERLDKDSIKITDLHLTDFVEIWLSKDKL